MGIVGFYGSILAALGVFFTLMVAGVIWGLLVVRLTDIEEEEPLLIELPPYRRPIVDNVLAKSWIRMKDFVYIVLPLLMVGGAFYGLLKLYDIPRRVIGPLSPISHWLGLPDPAIVPLLFGFLQKDLTGPILLSVMEGDLANLTLLQFYSFGVAATVGIPCVIALAMLWKEFGWKEAILLTIATITYGFLFAGLAWRILSVVAPFLG